MWFWDFDNDGVLDLFVPSYRGGKNDIVPVIAGYLDLPVEVELPALYRGDGRGGFENVAQRCGLTKVVLPMGANFGDIDNDGWLDIYLTTGDPNYESLMPNVMLRNDSGVRFQNVTHATGLGHLQKGHGVAFVDLDNDGDQDIYHQLGGFYPGDRFHNALFLNPGHGRHFIKIELVGTRSNRMAFGARIKLVVRNADGDREIHRAVGSVSSFGGSPRRQEIGLGDATRIRSLEIFWPRSGVRQELSDVPMDNLIRVTEGEAGFEKLPLHRVDLSKRRD